MKAYSLRRQQVYGFTPSCQPPRSGRYLLACLLLVDVRWPVLSDVDVEGAYGGDREPKQNDDDSENENKVQNGESAELGHPPRLSVVPDEKLFESAMM